MLPKELDILKTALEGKRYYTFSGGAQLCNELKQLDALLERVSQAKSLAEVQTALLTHSLDQHLVTRPPAGQAAVSI